MKLIVNKNRTTTSVGTWGTKNENDYEILEFEFPAELEEYNKRVVYYLDDERVWDAIVDNKAYITNAVTKYEKVKAYVWLTKENTEREADTDFRTKLFEMKFFENENADGIVPTEEQVDGFNTMLTAMNRKIDEVNALEQTIVAAEAERQEAEATRVSNESTRESNEATRQENEQTRQTQEAERERKTSEAIADIKDKTAEYNANAEEKTTAFNTNATQKTNDFNSNYTQKVNDFDSNASSKESAFNSNANSKTSAFNSNAETKTNAFNTNATNKTNDFNSNATEKTTAFNNNASTKASEFNSNAESKTSAFNDNATQKTTNFDNNASEKTDEFNTNAQNKIDEYDEHIVEYQAQIDELQEEVDELSENMPWIETEQATSIDITDGAKYSKNHLKVFGNTEQTQYSGKNLLNIADTQYTWNDISVEISNGIITLNGTPSTNTTNRNFASYTATEDGTYTLLPFKSSTNNNIRLLYSINGDSQQNSDNNPNINLTTGDVLSINFRVSTTDSISSFVLKPMLYKGTETTDYEPYVGGVPSPNPDYPQDIHVVTGDNTIGVTGKNVLRDDRESITTRGVTFTVNSDGSITAVGTSTSEFDLYVTLVGPVYLDQSKQYFLSGSPSTSSSTTYRLMGKVTKQDNTYQYIADNTGNGVQLPSSAKTISVYINIKNGISINTTFYPMVEEGTTKTSYEPYTHTDYPINLGSLELCKIGDYQDYLYKENGNWYKYGAIRKYTTPASVSTINRRVVLKARANLKNMESTTNVIARSFFNCHATSEARYNYGWGGLAFMFTVAEFAMIGVETAEEFRNWCDENLVCYVVINPTYDDIDITQITDETLIAQLNAIYEHFKLTKGINNITVTAEDLAPNMELSYMQDLPTKLNNLDSRLSLLE
jgi:hypothetical protein